MLNALAPLLGCALMVVAVAAIVIMASTRKNRGLTAVELAALRAEARTLRREDDSRTVGEETR